MKSKNFIQIFAFLLIVFNLITFVQNQSFYISPVRITNNCRENEVFTNCGSACDPTCENITISNKIDKQSNYEPYVVLDEPCKYNCIPGCYCRKPYYRNRFGECVDEEQCRKSFNRNDFVDELNKFLNLNFNSEDIKTRDSDSNGRINNESRPNQKYISANDDPFIDPRIGYHPRKTSYQTSSSSQNQHNIFNFEKDFFGNLFDDIFSHHLPKSSNNQRQSNYNPSYQTNDNGNINVNDSLEKQIEREADIIIQRITNGLKIKKFIIETLRNLVNKSQYNLGSLTSSSINDQKETKSGLIIA